MREFVQLPKRYVIGKEGISGQGPFMLFVLHVVGDTVVDANYNTYACPVADRCGQFVCEWVIGKQLSDVSCLTTEQIEASVGHMPLGREHVPILVKNALQNISEPE